ncbi:MAG TPA: DUF2071 domain-containing protein [Candidatus Limnocylindrales bacterium]|nr:DUF2071 domain-containing protein [Candidatus Limnocylindrales bacterium]
MSRRPWVMRMRWRDLLFAHWVVDVEALRPLVPSSLEIDTFEGRAYLGIVPFGMEDVAPRGLPAIPYLSAFPEVNVRTYVRRGEASGVWFFSLDASRRVAVEGARLFFHLPYFHARMSMERSDDEVVYRSSRRDRRGRPAELDVRYRPTGPIQPAPAGSLDRWLTERLRLFAVDRRGRVSTTSIAHVPWPLRPAEAEFRVETLSTAQGIALSGPPVHLAYADRLDVRAWWPRRLRDDGRGGGR